MTTTMASSTAIRRLVKDTRAFRKEERWSNFVVARQNPDNLLDFSVTFRPEYGKYARVPVHVHLTFSPQYPMEPPTVVVIGAHLYRFPFMIGDKLCIDMLNFSGYHGVVDPVPYEGWSPAYSLSSIVLQLYSFLFEEDPYMSKQPDVGASQKVLEQCKCGFHELPICDTVVGAAAVVTSQQPLEAAPYMDENIMSNIFSKMTHDDLGACSGFSATAWRLMQLRQIECYFSKCKFHEIVDDDVFGFGLSIVRGGRSGAVVSLSVRTDYLCRSAFDVDLVRLSPWNERIDVFMPLCLDRAHGVRAVAAFSRCIDEVMGPERDGRLDANKVLAVMGLAINGIVVEMVRKSSGSACRHMSEVALQGFCHLHHMLLAVAVEHPHVRDEAMRTVVEFQTSRAKRHKSHCPDLGRLMVAYLIVPEEVAPWSTFGKALFGELVSRQIMWTLRGHELATNQRLAAAFSAPSKQSPSATEMDHARRCNLQFHSSLVGLRNIMVQAWFANALARPKTRDPLELERIKGQYDDLVGSPGPVKFKSFAEHARKVLDVKKWSDVFAGLNMRLKGKDAPEMFANLSAILYRGFQDSYSAKYHTSPRPKVMMEEEEEDDIADGIEVLDTAW